eukprot:TRINITY_DN8515_c0_g2_i1.p1 TRINITY_DN8515_c0_g2~~TRINITY_DN8515_c0_g2_i1.p1  ORF type:complete len:654 (-),score=58.12 TRINITY_DN8515_c0_g2_i1:532-2328(-)
MQTIKTAVDAAYAVNGGQSPGNHGQFVSSRYAFLFKPGSYDVDVPVGYYTQVLGLGASPADVVFTSGRGVYCEEGSTDPHHGALSTFWRGAENFQTNAGTMLWAVSQATALRRVIASNDLNLYENSGYSSGGYIGNSQVKNSVNAGTQQQFFARNCQIGRWTGGAWNLVFVGVQGAPNADNTHLPVSETPVIAEKPFITVDTSGRYALNVPPIKNNRVGTDYGATLVDFEMVYVANAETDTASSINTKLAEGFHVILSPGIYNLQTALELTHANQVLLGIGLATLIPTNGNACVKVRDVPGVRVAGLLLQAGSVKSQTLLQWGVQNGTATTGVVSDVYARVGGPAEAAHAQCATMFEINTSRVILDNTWLWRADHTVDGETTTGQLPVDVGAVINGDDFVAYGFKVEHCLTDQVQWNGDRGRTYMFQSELPYDVTTDFGTNGYCGYRVADSVQQHMGYGIGVYHFFRDHPVRVKSGIVAPTSLEGQFEHAFTVHLAGQGTIEHDLNNEGNATGPGQSFLARVGYSPPQPWPIWTPSQPTRRHSMEGPLMLPAPQPEPSFCSCNNVECCELRCRSCRCFSSPVAAYSPVRVTTPQAIIA